MGIKLIDVANFAIGAIEKDRELTKENLAIRAEELASNREYLREQKKKKYDKELEKYYEEKEKFDTINQANKMYDLKSIDARTYAATILPLTNPNWKNLDEKTKQLNINNFDGKTVDYKIVGSPDEIEKQAAIINQKINSETASAIKDAKGNSFLINKILGEKKKAERDLLKEVEEKIKAADTVKMSEQNVDQQYVGKDVKVALSSSAFNNDPDADKYQEYWDKHRLKINMDIDGTKALRFFNTISMAGGSDDLTFSYDEQKAKIKGMNAPSIAYVEATRYMFNQIKDLDDQMIQHYNTVTKYYGNIGKTWNEETIFKKMEKEIPDRAGNINQGYGNPLVGNIRLTTVVPLSIVPLGAKFLNDKNEDVTKSTLKNISNDMNEYILRKTDILKKSGNFKDRTEQQIATYVYKKLYEGDEQYLSEFLGKPVENKIEKTTTTDTDTNSKKTTTINYTATKSNGKEGLAINGKFKSWEEIEAADAVKDLPEEQKLNYNTWKNKQGTSSDIIETNPMA